MSGAVQGQDLGREGEQGRGLQVSCHQAVIKLSQLSWCRIESEYFVHLIMDNLPCATMFTVPESGSAQYEPGYRLGYSGEGGKLYINNHLK